MTEYHVKTEQPNRCPKCGSKRVGNIIRENKFQFHHCKDCQYNWREIDRI